MTYEEAIAFWFGRVNYEQCPVQSRDLTLERMRALLAQLDNPQEKFDIIHVAGSKGKGSTSAMLASVLQQAGRRTGLFTSPHLVRVEERIQVEQEPISEADLTGRMEEVARAVALVERENPSDPGVTFFEIATALGFLHFARAGVEVGVIEVGLGGRFDSTNVCWPILSIITSISFDHTQVLGNTLAKIAREKAGIIKPGRPVISGARDTESRAVIEKIAHERDAPLCQLERDFNYVHQPALIRSESARPPQVQVTTASRRWPVMKLGLLGEHQAANASLVIAAVEQLRHQGIEIGDAAVAAGLADVIWPARLEIVSQQPWVILDCAHNVASAEAFIDTLQASFPVATNGKPSQRFLIFAGSRDKDVAGIMRLLSPQFSRMYLTRFANNLRYLAPEKLADLLPREGTPAFTLCPTATEAWRLAFAAAGPSDMICVTGSVFLAGELRPLVLQDVATRDSSCLASRHACGSSQIA